MNENCFCESWNPEEKGLVDEEVREVSFQLNRLLDDVVISKTDSMFFRTDIKSVTEDLCAIIAKILKDHSQLVGSLENCRHYGFSRCKFLFLHF